MPERDRKDQGEDSSKQACSCCGSLAIVESNSNNLKENLNASRPSEHPPVRGEKMSKRLRGIIGCKHKASSGHSKGFPDGSNIGSTV